MLAEMTGDFPELSRVFVEERDQYMAQMLLHCIEVIRKDLPPVIHTNTGEDVINKNLQNISEAMEAGDQSSDIVESSDKGDIPNEQNFSEVIRTDDKIDELDHEDNSNDIKEDEISHLDYEPVLVAVVGIGHMKGIVENIGKTCDLNELNKIPPATYTSRAFTMAVKAALVAAISWGVYSVIRWARS